ncbi:helix-turn-helix domain-containing protein [Micromonospora sp. STR1_7]|uniref:Helix-turn-helix domain-containing protein n=1 Tax=Micromonospora parastrephiae TaxID=2806101 RepID=A0ABS1XZF6_9ACTN|nr:helix-turn-helix domain-containing protein [Micromonospora parastrephiae]MBM0234635.1 helix-turn-helix domain-containing protein [Micromonospora parastrephiae]
MSVRVMTWVWDHSPVGGTERLVLLAIADFAADDGSNAWPSLGTLARKARLDERTVRRIIRRLQDGGHLLVDVAAGPGVPTGTPS